MSDAAPKPWVKALRIKSTPWRVLVGLWGHGSYKADGPAFVWVNRKKLADEIGLPLGTLKNGLDALAALGWIVRDGGGWRLAWMTPGNFTRPADGPGRPTDEPARPQADPARGEATPARGQADPRPADGPHNLQGTSNYPVSNFEEARDLNGLDQCGIAARTADEDAAVYGPSSAQAQLDRERAEVRARFSAPASDVLTPAMLDGLDPERRDAWRQEAAGGEYGTWSRAMGERARKLGLTREALGAAVLASWERECAELPPGVKPGQPDRGELWYAKHSAWLRRAALGDQEPESVFSFGPGPELTVVGGGS